MLAAAFLPVNDDRAVGGGGNACCLIGLYFEFLLPQVYLKSWKSFGRADRIDRLQIYPR